MKRVMHSILLASFVLPVAVHAHAVRLFARAEAKTQIAGYAYAAGGHRIREQVVTLRDAATGRVIAEQTTDHAGQFAFPVTADGAYLVAIDLGDGHRAEWPVQVGSAASANVGEPPTPAPDARGRDILAGIGYIVGLFGLLAWWKSRTASTGRSA